MSWNRTLVRTHDEDARCATSVRCRPMIMPLAVRIHLCSNHAARAAQKHGLAFPTVRP